MILITGATGQLGKSVVEQLTKRIAANQIVAFVRDESKASVIKEKGVTWPWATTTTFLHSIRPCAGLKKSC